VEESPRRPDCEDSGDLVPKYTVEWLNPERQSAIVTETADKEWPWSRPKVRKAEVYLDGSYWKFRATSQFASEVDRFLDNEKKRAEELDNEKKNWVVQTELPPARVVQK
jgi:hypothetical protein